MVGSVGSKFKKGGLLMVVRWSELGRLRAYIMHSWGTSPDWRNIRGSMHGEVLEEVFGDLVPCQTWSLRVQKCLIHVLNYWTWAEARAKVKRDRPKEKKKTRTWDKTTKQERTRKKPVDQRIQLNQIGYCQQHRQARGSHQWLAERKHRVERKHREWSRTKARGPAYGHGRGLPRWR